MKYLDCPYCDGGQFAVENYRGRCSHCLSRIRVIVRKADGIWESRCWRWALHWNGDIGKMQLEI